jgi:hypothetical protein
MQLVVSVKADKPLKLNTYFVVQVRGGKNIKVPVKCNIDVPTVTIKQDEIDFGSTYLGATNIQPLNIENTSDIPALFTLDLRKHPEFGVRIPDELEYEDDSDEQQGGHQEEPLPESVLTGPLAKFMIAPKSEGKIELTYCPASLGNPAFELPLTLLGIVGKDAKALRRAVVAEANKPRLLLSAPCVDFEKRIVVNENMVNFNYSLEITLTNCADEPCLMDARLEGNLVTEGVFKMQDSTSDLAPGKSHTLNVSFIPRSDGEFRCQLRIYTDNNFEQPYFDLLVMGTAVYPSLGFDRREVLLPVTPIGQQSTVVFEVINYGYDNLNLKYSLPADATAVPMTLNFPNGTMTNVVNTRLPVELTFSAQKSMSFGTKIDFMDQNGNKYSIPVLGTTDASVLTVFPFLKLHNESVAIKGGERAPYLKITGPIHSGVLNDDGEIQMEDALAAPVNGKVVNLIPPNSEFLCDCKVLTEKASVRTLMNWANVTIFRTSVNEFPLDIHEARGKQVIDVVEASTGKTVPGQMKKVPANRKEEAQMLLVQYTELLSTLKAYGGLVGAIKPEYLLRKDDFQRLFLEKGPTVIPIQLRNFYHQHYELINEGSWMMLMYQIVKLFVFNRVTVKLLRSTPGVDPALTKDLHMSGSNLYSTSELVLLSWFSYHFRLTQQKAQILNFDKDLHDCRVFGAVIASHVPSLMNTMATLKKTDVLQERIANAQVVISACRTIGLEYLPAPPQLAQGSARDLMLFSVYLFNSLPALIPRAKIDFDGRLNDKVVKHIELTNPSGKPLVYTIRIDGSKSFTCADSLKIGARDKIKFPITCLHTTRDSSKAQILFIGERVAGGSAGITLVFDLESSVKSFKRTEVITKQTKLYEQITFEIPVKNNDVENDSMLHISLVPLSPEPRRGGQSPKRGKGSAGPSKTGKTGNVTNSLLLPDMTFWIKVDKMKLKRRASNVVKINLIPLQLQAHACLVFIKDDLVGETCYELQAKVDLPQQTDFNKFQQQMKSTVIKDIPISLRNSSIDKCRSGLMELMGPEGKDWFKKVFEQPQVEYKVEYFTECFSGPKVFSLYGPNALPKQLPTAGKPQPAMNNKLPLEVRPVGPGKYEGRIIMRSAFDVRVLDVEATLTVLGTRAELSFSCPARQAISQDIPIINHSEQEWSIQAALNGKYFSGSKEFKVPPMGPNGPGTAMYTLTFAPSWIDTIAGELTLRNLTVGDSYVYELTGVGEDPVAEDHHTIECVARKRTKDTLLVRNILGDQDCEYEVECDLLGVSGSAKFFVEADTEAEYNMSIMMPRGGNFTGSISFKAPNREYIWYTIEVTAESPASEREITLEAKARTAIIADIPIMNPLDETVTFDVVFEGEGLIGAPSITIEPGQSAKYELVYSPLLADDSEGKCTFVNNEMGEFWYLLYLKAEEADSIVCEPMTAQLGRTETLRLTAENPISEDIQFEVQITNPQNFSVTYTPKSGMTYQEGVLEIDAYHEAAFDVIYTPTSVGEVEETDIILVHPIAGRWVYRVSGRGNISRNENPPWDGKGVVEMPAISTSSVVVQASSNLLKFKNPLNKHLTVQLHLHQEPNDQERPRSRHEEDMPFRILLGQRTMHLAPFQDVEVPFLFCPTKMTRHQALMEFEVVEMEQDGGKVPLGEDAFCFVYPIVGTADAPGTVYLGTFTTRARERMDAVLQLPLTGIGSIALKEKIEIEVVKPDEHKQMLDKALVIKRDLANREGLATGIVRCSMSFEPLKSVRTRLQIKVAPESGGRWVFELDLIANDAEVDDVIKIDSAMNQERSVSFRMTNQFDERVPFNAYFTADSSAEFSVAPEMGILEPYSSTTGTNFVISFRPQSYGKSYKGKLVVETNEMQWTYEVHGQQPKYQAPKNPRAKVDTHIYAELDPEVYKGRQVQTKYLKENANELKKQQQQMRQRAAGSES